MAPVGTGFGPSPVDRVLYWIWRWHILWHQMLPCAAAIIVPQEHAGAPDGPVGSLWQFCMCGLSLYLVSRMHLANYAPSYCCHVSAPLGLDVHAAELHCCCVHATPWSYALFLYACTGVPDQRLALPAFETPLTKVMLCAGVIRCSVVKHAKPS